MSSTGSQHEERGCHDLRDAQPIHSPDLREKPCRPVNSNVERLLSKNPNVAFGSILLKNSKFRCSEFQPKTIPIGNPVQ